MRIVLVSDDADFFEYISPKLALRKSDELFRFTFEDLPEKLHLLLTSVMLINSEKSEDKTLELLDILRETPVIVFAFNNNDKFTLDVIKKGALGLITPMISDEELRAKLIPALNQASILEKKDRYRELLVRNKLIAQNNEVFIDYNTILDKELEKIDKTSSPAVLAAISPDERTKFLLQSNQIETIILNNIRKNDILMNYATNKYFLLFYDTDMNSAKKIWQKIAEKIPEKIYAGFALAVGKKRQQIVNEVLNRLHEAINYEKVSGGGNGAGIDNFKLYRQEFNKNIEKIVTPVYYQVRQKYNDKLFGMSINENSGDGFSSLTISSRNYSSTFKITSPGFSKINIDITYSTNTAPKRIALEPHELEAGLLEDLLEQFIEEFKKEINDDTN